MTLCGTPDEEFMKKITSVEARNYIRTLPVSVYSWTYFHSTSENLLELMVI